MLKMVNKLIRDEEGATAVEYGLIVAAIAAVIVATVFALGDKISAAFTTVDSQMETGAGTGTGG